MQIDRGAYPDARTPWEDPSWRATALDWLDRQLAVLDVCETGPRRVRLRPWSVIIRVLAERPVWFKATSPGSAFEPALSEALSRWAPEHVLTPYAVDAARGWSLLPDGGPLLRAQSLDVRHWEQVLVQYADLQRALVPRVDELVRLGVPDARKLPRLFDETVAGNRTLGVDEREWLLAFRPRLVDWCAELAGFGIPATLDHADLHDGQILVAGPGRYTFFDWGDANVAHPFCSLLVALDRAAEQLGPEVVARLEDAYLEPWTAEHPRSALHRAATLARRLSHLTRAGSWGRLFPATAHIGDPERAAALLRML
ncbi:aminoglycoside phosphotransferase family protein [Kribbella sp. NBC_00709]|uniref:phosphotransferase n=1 Tax=Kribbella sp. NBC_00709 TaxID=2975972 RepID=UPI002E2C069E|nr:phosphotransferase [Kribbella sp. NBC_00709]